LKTGEFCHQEELSKVVKLNPDIEIAWKDPKESVQELAEQLLNVLNEFLAAGHLNWVEYMGVIELARDYVKDAFYEE